MDVGPAEPGLRGAVGVGPDDHLALQGTTTPPPPPVLSVGVIWCPRTMSSPDQTELNMRVSYRSLAAAYLSRVIPELRGLSTLP